MAAKIISRTQAPRQPHLRLGDTPYGKGIFTKKSIQRGEIVGVITGEVLSEDEFESEYCMDLGHDLVLEPRNIFRRINHSCDPNSELVAFEDADDYRIEVEALRDIAPGEQITVDYAWSDDHAIPCQCASKNCRGWIIDKDQLSDFLEAREKIAS